MDAKASYDKGDYWTAALHTGLAISDLGGVSALVKTAAKVVGKEALKEGAKQLGKEGGEQAAAATAKAASESQAKQVVLKETAEATEKQAVGQICTGGTCKGKGLCFVAGTMVQTPIGPKPIENIVPGDMVYSHDPVAQQTAFKPVVAVRTNEGMAVLELHVAEAGRPEIVDIIRATLEHPFWVEGKGWTDARKLSPGDRLLQFMGRTLIVQEVVAAPGVHVTYNFEVRDFHTYFVGSFGVLVHNTEVCDSASIAQKEKKVPNPDGQNGKQDHKDKVAELVEKATLELNPGEKILQNKRVAGFPGLKRNPDVQILDAKGRTRKIFEAERNPTHKRNKKREKDYDDAKIEHETHKVGKVKS